MITTTTTTTTTTMTERKQDMAIIHPVEEVISEEAKIPEVISEEDEVMGAAIFEVTITNEASIMEIRDHRTNLEWIRSRGINATTVRTATNPESQSHHCSRQQLKTQK